LYGFVLLGLDEIVFNNYPLAKSNFHS
jgi:hypothetical protein